MNTSRRASMKPALALALLLALGAAGASSRLRPGAQAPDFTLKDGAGNEYSLDRARNNGITVIIFISTHCPASNGYNRRMAELYSDYVPKHVSFFGINSNKGENAAEVLEHAQKHDLRFPVLKDENNTVADAYGAQVTPEAFVIDGNGKLRYHGRIDDDGRGTNITTKDLRVALDALLGGKEVSVAETRIFGCGIDRAKGND